MALLGELANAGASIAGAGIGAAGSLLGSVGNMVFNGVQARKQREWNEQMMNKQNAWNEEMWNKTNEYNSPVSQIERLRDAGLNPLFYGLDGSSANAMESAQPLAYERAQVGSIDNPVTSGLSAAAQIAQISNIQADTAKKNNENLTETARREQILTDISKAKQEMENMLADKSLTEARRKEIEKGLEWADRLNQAVLNEKAAKINLDESQKKRIDELLQGEKLLQAKSIEDFEHKWAKIDAEIAKIAKETDIAQLDIENYVLNHMSNGIGGSGVSVQNFHRLLRDWLNLDEGNGYSKPTIPQSGVR